MDNKKDFYFVDIPEEHVRDYYYDDDIDEADKYTIEYRYDRKTEGDGISASIPHIGKLPADKWVGSGLYKCRDSTIASTATQTLLTVQGYTNIYILEGSLLYFRFILHGYEIDKRGTLYTRKLYTSTAHDGRELQTVIAKLLYPTADIMGSIVRQSTIRMVCALSVCNKYLYGVCKKYYPLKARLSAMLSGYNNSGDSDTCGLSTSKRLYVLLERLPPIEVVEEAFRLCSITCNSIYGHLTAAKLGILVVNNSLRISRAIKYIKESSGDIDYSLVDFVRILEESNYKYNKEEIYKQ